MYILHKDGAYNLYSWRADGPMYTSALTLGQLKRALTECSEGLDDFDARVARAQQKGTSSHLEDSLEDTISDNRAGPNGTVMPVEEFISRFMRVAT
jgi:hypothetical protein